MAGLIDFLAPNNPLASLIPSGDKLGDVGLGLLSAGGPSKFPVSFGGALAQGLGFAQQREQQRLESQLKIAQLDAAIREKQSKQEATQRRQQAIEQAQGLISGLDIPEEQKAILSGLIPLGPEQVASTLASRLLPKPVDNNILEIAAASDIDMTDPVQRRQLLAELNAGKGTTIVNQAQKHVSKLFETVGVEQGKRIVERLQQGDKAQRSNSNLLRLRQLLDSGEVRTGSLAGVTVQAQGLLEALGISPDVLPGDLASTQEFTAIVAQQVFNVIDSLGVGVSDADREFIVSTMPTLARTVEGNKQIIDFMVGMNRNVIQKNIEMNDLLARAGQMTEQEAIRAFSDLDNKWARASVREVEDYIAENREFQALRDQIRAARGLE